MEINPNKQSASMTIRFDDSEPKALAMLVCSQLGGGCGQPWPKWRK